LLGGMAFRPSLRRRPCSAAWANAWDVGNRFTVRTEALQEVSHALGAVLGRQPVDLGLPAGGEP
jgi:hypothetical protein